MTENDKDPNLQAPQESNTTKHINFREVDEADANSGGQDNDSSLEDDSPTKKAWEELREDNKKSSSSE